MTFGDWVNESYQRVRDDGVAGVRESVRELYVGVLRRVNEFYPEGTNVYDRQWDVLVLLDGCRTDLLAEVADEYDFLDSPDTLTSVGSSSIQWIENTFTEGRRAEFAETAYVTGNPFSHRVLTDDDLHTLDEVWRYAWDDDAGTIPARPLTDRAIATMREDDPDQLVVHYMQPHFPSLPEPLGGGMNSETLGEGEGWDSPWDRLRRGELDYETVWSSYRKNLRYVLDDVEVLLENVDAERVVISADHGNAAGEYGVYGHPKVPLRVLREVPWYTTTAEDRGTHEPSLDPGSDAGDIEDKLSALGYM